MIYYSNNNSKQNFTYSRKLKVLFWLCFSFLFFIIILSYLSVTSLGFSLIVKIAQPILNRYDITIQQGEINGNLSSFEIPGLTIKEDNTKVVLHNVQIDWQPFDLILGKLTVNSAHVNKLNIYVDANKIKSDNKNIDTNNISKFTFPLSLRAGKLSIDRTLIQVNKTLIELSQTKVDVKILKNLLYFDNVSSKAFNNEVFIQKGVGKLILDDPYIINLDFNWQYQHGKFKTDNVRASILGPLAEQFELKNQGNLTVNNKQIAFQANTLIDGPIVKTQVKQFKHAKFSSSGSLILDFTHNLNWQASFVGEYGNKSPKLNKQPEKILATISGTVTQNKKNNDILKFNKCTIQINKHNLICNGLIGFNNNDYEIQDVNIKNKDNDDFIHIYGKISSKLALNWNLNISNIANYFNDISAKFHSKGHLLGSVSEPKLISSNVLTNFSYKKISIAKIQLSTSDINNDQLIDVQLDSSKVNANAKIKGHWQNDNWQGLLENLTVDYQHKWKLQSATQFSLSENSIKLKPICMINTSNKKLNLCFSLQKQVNDLNINLNGLVTPEIFKSFAPIKSASSLLKVTAKYTQKENKLSSAFLHIEATKGDVDIARKKNFASQFFSRKPRVIKVNHATARVNLNQNNQLDFSIDSSFNNGDFIKSKGQIKSFDFVKFKDNQIQASLAVNWKNIDFLSRLVAFPTNANGKLQVNLNMKGSINNPSVTGNINIKDQLINIIPLGISLKNTSLNIGVSPPLNIKVKGQTTINHKNLDVNGYANYNQKGNNIWNIDILIDGDDIMVMNLPQLELIISPNLTIKVKNKDLYVSGNILINKAVIHADKLNSLKSGGSITTDITYVKNGKVEIKKKENYPIASNVNIDFGSNTKVYGFGLSSYITGKLHVSNSPNAITLANGKLYFKNGIYQIYGKEFNITDASAISYNYTPIIDPELKIVANYNQPVSLQLSTNAPSSLGVSITGKVQDMKLKLISTPTLSQANILSYIILGQPINEDTTTSSSNDLSKAAAIFVLNGGSNVILDDIKNKLGINEISVGTLSNDTIYNDQLQSISAGNQVGQDNTAIFIGKSISPRFYVSYGVGIFTGQQEVNAIYTINRNWKFRMDKTDLDVGGDIIYQITP